MNVATNEIKALIQLIDDPSDEIFATVREKIISFGEAVIPELEICWETKNYGLTFQDRVANIIHDIQFQKTISALSNWLDSSERSLLDGATLVTRYVYPDIDIIKIYDFIAQIERDVWLEYSEDLTALEQVKILNHIFFKVFNFKGDTNHFHAPENSLISDVIETRRGNPLLLSVVYSIVAQRLKIPIYGVNLPKHFVLAYVDEENLIGMLTGQTQMDKTVLFYVNPFSQGVVFEKSDIDSFLEHLDIAKKDQFYEPCSNSDMVKRMLINLRYSYAKRENRTRVEELDVLIQMFG